LVKTDPSLHDAGARRHLSLSDLYRGESATVAGLVESAHIDSGRDASQSLITRLRDLGFVPGARCEVVARMWPGGNPIAVRIGGSTFALRRAEAAAVRVQLAHEPGVARDPGPRAGASAVAA
jgi:ferrous iron transport protein A